MNSQTENIVVQAQSEPVEEIDDQAYPWIGKYTRDDLYQSAVMQFNEDISQGKTEAPIRPEIIYRISACNLKKEIQKTSAKWWEDLIR